MPLRKLVALACCLGLCGAEAFAASLTSITSVSAGTGACTDTDTSPVSPSHTGTASAANCNGSWAAATSEVDRMSATVRVTAFASGPPVRDPYSEPPQTTSASSRAELTDVWTVTVTRPPSYYAESHFFVTWALTVHESPDVVYGNDFSSRAIVNIEQNSFSNLSMESFIAAGAPHGDAVYRGGGFIDASEVGTQQYDVFVSLYAGDLVAGSVDYSLYLAGEWRDGIEVTNDLGAITLAAVPEPDSAALLLAGLPLAALARRRRELACRKAITA